MEQLAVYITAVKLFLKRNNILNVCRMVKEFNTTHFLYINIKTNSSPPNI
jgi:hypothetical protein